MCSHNCPVWNFVACTPLQVSKVVSYGVVRHRPFKWGCGEGRTSVKDNFIFENAGLRCSICEVSLLFVAALRPGT